MAPSFLNFKELRRRSRASFRTEHSTDTSSEGAASQGTEPSSGSLTPPSVAHNSDPALNLQLKDVKELKESDESPSPLEHPQRRARPALTSTANSSRYSVSSMSGLGGPPNGKTSLPSSPYAPRIHNVSENAWVYQKVLIVHGAIGEPSHQTYDGTVTVTRLDDSFPPVSWPVCESHFKALVYLQPGPNKLRFDFSSPKLPNSTTSSNPIHASYLTVHMIPALNAPPLQLAILLAKDSPETFDAVPARAEREGNGLETAVRKFRMAAYLWQAFTAEQMWRQKLGRRSFRFEEEWTAGSANQRDRENNAMRSEARIHIIRSDKTLAELRDLNKAQQYDKATDKNALFGIAADAVKSYFQSPPGQKQYVSVMLLDAHWDREVQTIVGHAAMGGPVGDLHLSVFGSHCLQSYPTSFEEVVPAFTDCTPTDTNFVANDSGDAGSSWEAANMGIGAHLHETGHLFGCPHQEGGIMYRDYVVLNRSFVAREAYATRTRTRGGVALPDDECGWHRLDCLRFRTHPAFRLPNDPPMHSDASVQVFPGEGGNVMALAATGIIFVEIYGEGDDVCHSWIEYLSDNGSVQRQVTLTEQDLRARLPEAKRKGRVKITIKSYGGGSLTIDDFKTFASKSSSIKLGSLLGSALVSGKTAFRSGRIGPANVDKSNVHEVIFTSAVKQDRVLSRVVVYHGQAVEGLEFIYDDDSRQMFGKGDSKDNIDTFEFDVRRGEYISGFTIQADEAINGIRILTSIGRKSPMFGGAQGGAAQTMIPPRGYTICGVSGTCGSTWLDGFSVLIKK
ncbi:putative peptidase family-domain-containing protein [Stachybotrys elegans]|uniref:Peptidase family-domain-containing protein n=1 Tax=Stachybotrys elegans TaxID=80388 RepID=A0A8K0WUE0_9HYPO|nr:putative peptidase family-domain-containing protein [Stachybotrys elegans]